MPNMTYEYAEFLAKFEEQSNSLRTDTDELIAATTSLRDHDVDAAWNRIEKAANRLVAKSGLTEEQAVQRFLDTSEGREAYVDYQAAFAARLAGEERFAQKIQKREAAYAILDQSHARIDRAFATGGDDAADEALAAETARPVYGEALDTIRPTKRPS